MNNNPKRNTTGRKNPDPLVDEHGDVYKVDNSVTQHAPATDTTPVARAIGFGALVVGLAVGIPLLLLTCSGIGGSILAFGPGLPQFAWWDNDDDKTETIYDVKVETVGVTYMPGSDLDTFRLPDGRKAVQFFVFNPNTQLGIQARSEGREKDNGYREEVWVTAKKGHSLPVAESVCWRKADKDKNIDSGIVKGSPTRDDTACVVDDKTIEGVKVEKIAIDETGHRLVASDFYGVVSPHQWTDIGGGLEAICDPFGARGGSSMAPACSLPGDDRVARNTR